MANKVECNNYLNMAFLSKFATETNRAFSVIMRIFFSFEIQDIMTQMTQLNCNILFGSVNLPQFLFSEQNISLQLDKLYNMVDQKLKLDIDTANENIETVKEESTTTMDDIILYTVAAFTAYSTVVVTVLVVIRPL